MYLVTSGVFFVFCHMAILGITTQVNSMASMVDTSESKSLGENHLLQCSQVQYGQKTHQVANDLPKIQEANPSDDDIESSVAKFFPGLRRLRVEPSTSVRQTYPSIEKPRSSTKRPRPSRSLRGGIEQTAAATTTEFNKTPRVIEGTSVQTPRAHHYKDSLACPENVGVIPTEAKVASEDFLEEMLDDVYLDGNCDGDFESFFEEN
jgi:hypothetical protein